MDADRTQGVTGGRISVDTHQLEYFLSNDFGQSFKGFQSLLMKEKKESLDLKAKNRNTINHIIFQKSVIRLTFYKNCAPGYSAFCADSIQYVCRNKVRARAITTG